MHDRVGAVFAALADPHRRYVVEMLTKRGSVTATELSGELPITRQAVSKHLGALRDAGLVGSDRSGRETRYRLTPAALSDAASWMERVGVEWDERLASLREHLDEGSG